MKYTLAFDVYGTLINTSGVFTTLEKMIGKQATLFMDLWRNKQLEYSFRRGLMNRFVDFSVVTKDALSFCCHTFKIDLNETQIQTLMNEYKVLPTFSDTKTALENLKKDGHRLFAFSNGSYKAVTKLLENSSIIEYFEGVVSVENTAMFKPSPLVYKHFNDVTSSKAAESWLISGNSFDVIGATAYGMKSAWVKRSKNVIFDPWGISPTLVINELTELSQKLSSI